MPPPPRKLAPTTFAFTAAIALALALAAGACASDPGAAPSLGGDYDAAEEAAPLEVDPIDDGGSSDADTDGDGAETDDVGDTLGCPCARNEECASGYCVDGGARTGRICSELCSTTCSLPDYDCVVLVTSGADAVQLCVPSWRSFCEPCTSDRSCGRLGDVCLELDDGTHCATDCAETGNCPPGGFCASVDVGGEVRSLCVPEDDICSPCFDEDSDGYGRGPECLGPDCDDDNPDAHPGHVELCDEVDNDCDLFVDEDFDLAGDPANCGACGNARALDRAASRSASSPPASSAGATTVGPRAMGTPRPAASALKRSSTPAVVVMRWSGRPVIRAARARRAHWPVMARMPSSASEGPAARARPWATRAVAAGSWPERSATRAGRAVRARWRATAPKP
jgi:hypothetical protein